MFWLVCALAARAAAVGVCHFNSVQGECLDAAACGAARDLTPFGTPGVDAGCADYANEIKCCTERPGQGNNGQGNNGQGNNGQGDNGQGDNGGGAGTDTCSGWMQWIGLCGDDAPPPVQPLPPVVPKTCAVNGIAGTCIGECAPPNKLYFWGQPGVSDGCRGEVSPIKCCAPISAGSVDPDPQPQPTVPPGHVPPLPGDQGPCAPPHLPDEQIGVCRRTQDCRLPFATFTGRQGAVGCENIRDANVQCCAAADDEAPSEAPPDHQGTCTSPGGNTGFCLPTPQCSKTSYRSRQGANGCGHIRDGQVQCCTDKDTAPIFTGNRNLPTSGTVSQCQAAALLQDAGVPHAYISKLVCTAKYESSYRCDARNLANSDGTGDYGLWQANSRWWCTGGRGRNSGNGCDVSCEELSNCQVAARCAATILARHRNGPPRSMSAWVAYAKHKTECDAYRVPPACTRAFLVGEDGEKYEVFTGDVDEGTLSVGAIVGIALGVLVCCVVLGGAAALFALRSRNDAHDLIVAGNPLREQQISAAADDMLSARSARAPADSARLGGTFGAPVFDTGTIGGASQTYSFSERVSPVSQPNLDTGTISPSTRGYADAGTVSPTQFTCNECSKSYHHVEDLSKHVELRHAQNYDRVPY